MQNFSTLRTIVNHITTSSCNLALLPDLIQKEAHKYMYDNKSNTDTGFKINLQQFEDLLRRPKWL